MNKNNQSSSVENQNNYAAINDRNIEEPELNVINNEPEGERSTEGYRKLVYYKEKEFVFHGSIHKDILMLKPQEPHDVGTDSWNKDVAVYATIKPAYAVIFALISGFKGIFNVDSCSSGKITATFSNSFADQLSHNKGYVYVLNGDCFTERKGLQCKSRVEVEPVDIIEVTLNDYKSLGGIVNFI